MRSSLYHRRHKAALTVSNIKLVSFRLLTATVAAIFLAFGITGLNLTFNSATARASTQQTLRQQALSLSLAITTDQARLEVLDEQYLQSKIQLSQLTGLIKHDSMVILLEKTKIGAMKSKLRSIAVSDYVTQNNPSSLAQSLFGETNIESLPLQETYSETAAGLVTNELSLLNILEHKVTVHVQTLQKAKNTASTTEAKLANERSKEMSITEHLSGELSLVHGQLAVLVRQENSSQQVLDVNNTVIGQATKQATNSSIPPDKIAVDNTNISSSDTLGLRAVDAAKSQLGVPYVWGGAAPGVGFDCSGLTMWSWAQAGISLPHSAELQYMDITHVSLQNLQPGDLIFYADNGYIYHVIMYVGTGPYGQNTAIQAEETGTNISYTPILPGAFAAGRP